MVKGWPSDDVRLLALYLLTCEHRTAEGLFRLPKVYAADDLGWSKPKLERCWRHLVDDGFIGWDKDAQVVLIHRAIHYQPPANDKVVLGALKRLADVPRSHLLVVFAESLDELDGKSADNFRAGVQRLIHDAGFGDELHAHTTQLWQGRRLKVIERDGSACVACGETESLHVDHILPRSRGGTHELDNLQTLCAPHNIEKADRTNAEWLADPSATVCEPYRNRLETVSNSLSLALPHTQALSLADSEPLPWLDEETRNERMTEARESLETTGDPR